ncbi:MAG TPA: glycosyltransferase family 2 protein [Phototrophicaceae bacterium]|nr:glycosyltransferase family 2 protein [Phototrophicaceae bacterium]
MALDVSIIIVNWNTADLLAQCLRAVEQTIQRVTYDIWVVDNASSDGSPDMVRRDFPQVRLIASAENVGFAKANNQALRLAEGRYVLLLNSDAFVEANTIDRMVAFLDEHPEAGMAACKLLYEDRRLQRSCSTYPTLATEFYITLGLDKLFPHSPVFGRYLMTDWDYASVRDVDVIMGAFMLVRASVLPQVGLLDESFFMYSEEVDWCYRFQQAGWKILFTPEVETVHLWGGSTATIPVETLIRLYRSRVHFFRKHYGRLTANLFKGLLVLNCLVRIGPGALYYLPRPQRRQKHYAFRKLLQVVPSF